MQEPPSNPDPTIQFFNEFAEVGSLQNRLPHWRQDHATYFITFRLNDSLPAHLLAEWRAEREQWLQSHPPPWTSSIEMDYHKRFSKQIDQWMDAGHGSCLLAQPEHAEQVATCLHHDDGSKYLIHSQVIMPNHVHVLMSPAPGESLSRIVASWKRFSATRINKAREAPGALWQKDYFDRLIRDWQHFSNVARYIRSNPGKAKLTSEHDTLYDAPWIQRLLS
jgi:REP element-mobilizing transposase RayT